MEMRTSSNTRAATAAGRECSCSSNVAALTIARVLPSLADFV